MLYIHQSTCVSPQQTFLQPDIAQLHEPVEQKLKAIEPSYNGIPPGVLRRMGKAVRMSVGAAMPLLKQTTPPDGIIIGTADGGMEDCIKFLNQIIQYEEGMLTPGNFVNSTANAIAAQISLLSRNKGYNITHVHRAHAFENALIDAAMLVNEHPGNSYLVGAVDEISAYNYNLDFLAGWYKQEAVTGMQLYHVDSPGSIAGEGASIFMVSSVQDTAMAQLKGIGIRNSESTGEVKEQMQDFLFRNLPAGEPIDVFLTGENGDNRLLKYYAVCEAMLEDSAAIARFKHMSGEYATASAMALWLACYVLQHQTMPQHMLKKSGTSMEYRNVLIYNTFKGAQHSFMLISKTNNHL